MNVMTSSEIEVTFCLLVRLEDAHVVDLKAPRVGIKYETIFKYEFALNVGRVTVRTDCFLFPMPTRWWRWWVYCKA